MKARAEAGESDGSSGESSDTEVVIMGVEIKVSDSGIFYGMV